MHAIPDLHHFVAFAVDALLNGVRVSNRAQPALAALEALRGDVLRLLLAALHFSAHTLTDHLLRNGATNYTNNHNCCNNYAHFLKSM